MQKSRSNKYINKRIKIAHCVVALSGGVGSMIMNYFDHMKDEYEIHIITQDLVSEEYKNIYERRGYIIHLVPSKREGISKNIKALKEIFRKERFDIVHAHMTFTNVFPLFAAKTVGIPVRISHSHLSGKADLRARIAAILNKMAATDLFACGEEAGKVLYGKSKFMLIKNAISLKEYQYNEEIRKIQRELLGFKASDRIYCHVGRFTDQKNHTFLIDIFSEIAKKDNHAKLILIGEGELEIKIREKVKAVKLEEKVIFAGFVEDVPLKLQAVDVFLLPSKVEGLCIAAIEAQAAGLPCILSEQVDPATKVNDNVEFASIHSAEQWVELAEKCIGTDRIQENKKLEAAGFDIDCEAEKLDKYYHKKLKYC